MRVITIKIEEDLLELLDAYAIRHRMYRSEAIREAIKLLIEKEKKESRITQAKVEKGFRVR
jgi:metal-responsive CopG/Arc/MetJ family transcriptional regulator